MPARSEVAQLLITILPIVVNQTPSLAQSQMEQELNLGMGHLTVVVLLWDVMPVLIRSLALVTLRAREHNTMIQSLKFVLQIH